jgi:hypothetical protein
MVRLGIDRPRLIALQYLEAQPPPVALAGFDGPEQPS